MGIYNRDYLREDEESAGFGSSGARQAPRSIVVRLLIVTAAVFALQLMTARPGFDSLVQIWLNLNSESLFSQGQVWRLLTYAFCHSQENLLHIIFNMYLLYIIGKVVAQLTGEREFLWFYLVSAVFAGMCSIIFYNIVKLPCQIIGASGAVYAVFMVFAMHYPRQRVYIFGLIPIEVRWLLAIFIVVDALPVLNMLMGDRQEVSQVANSAHLGGLLFGFLYFRWNMRISNWWDHFAGRMPALRRKRKDLRVFNPGIQPDTTSLPENVDEILAKISREGEGSLTARERNILTQASRQLRKDRH